MNIGIVIYLLCGAAFLLVCLQFWSRNDPHDY